MRKSRASVVCVICDTVFNVPKYREKSARYCSSICNAEGRRRAWQGNSLRKGIPPVNAFKPDQTAWNKGLVGIHLSPQTEFRVGHRPINAQPIGTIRQRNRSRDRSSRNWIKTAEPNVWMPLSRYVWEQIHGHLPKGVIIHHRDGNSLNDSIENLAQVSRAEHSRIHGLLRNGLLMP